MLYAVIFNNEVINIIIAEPETINTVDFGGGLAVPINGQELAIGWGWDGENFIAPGIVEPPAQPKPYQWYIDIGPFFDRFGTAKMAVLTSSDVGVQAIIKDTQIRKWLDLKLPEIASAVAYIGTKVPSVTRELQKSILNTPVAETENLALRKLYFS